MADGVRPMRRPPSRTGKRTYTVLYQHPLEAAYVQWLKTRLHHSHIVLDYAGGRPTVEVLDLAKRIHKVSKVKGAPVDEVWCLTCDAPFSSSPGLPSSVHIASSQPGIELWLLLHFQELDNAVSRQEVSSMLQGHLQSSGEDTPNLEPLAGRFAIARKRAVALNAEGPSLLTSTYRLVDSIRESLAGFNGTPQLADDQP